MVAGFAVSLGTMILLIAGALACAAFLPAWTVVPPVYLSLPFLCYVIFAQIGWEDGEPSSALKTIVLTFFSHVLVYTIAYWRNGLLYSGEFVEVPFYDALYFSLTSWTTTGYGDFSPTSEIRLVASSQSLLGIFSMGIFIAIVTNWIQKRSEVRAEVLAHNRGVVEGVMRTPEEREKD